MMQVRPPLRGWLGGKSRLTKTIIPLIPEHKCYAEVFSGAAWIMFSKPESKCEVLNDFNAEIINLYRVLQHHLDTFIQQFRWLLVSRESFQRFWQMLPETLTDIHRAVRFFYIHRNCFGGRVSNASFGYATERAPKLNLLRIEEELSAVHLRLSQVYIEHLPYADMIQRYDRPHTFLYLDPPYVEHENDYGKDMFNRDDFAILAELMGNLQGKALMSINDKPLIRDLFSQFCIQEVKTNYSAGKGIHKPVTELLIANYDIS
jgi:DNA adenine methylase